MNQCIVTWSLELVTAHKLCGYPSGPNTLRLPQPLRDPLRVCKRQTPRFQTPNGPQRPAQGTSLKQGMTLIQHAGTPSLEGAGRSK